MQIFGNESVNHSDASDASLLHWALRSAVFRVRVRLVMSTTYQQNVTLCSGRRDSAFSLQVW